MTKTDSKLIVLSAGGTGGHLTPALALAHDLLARGYRVALVTDGRAKTYGLKIDGKITVYTVKAGTLGKGLMGKIKGAAALATGLVQARLLIRKIKPAVVVGFGGYPSYPAVNAAQAEKIPTIIHEQNAVLGKANAMLAPKAERIALSYPHVHGIEGADEVRAVVTGNPVRPEISALYTVPYPTPEHDGPLRIFITGGSLGAHVFAAVVPAALARLSDPQKARLEITQQCRAEDVDQVMADYKAAGIKAECASFFNDVHERLAAAHLFIGRSGAATTAEVAVAGRPAIFVPYPHHADQQQKINAEAMADAGGAWVMIQEGFTEDALRTRIETFLQNPESLFQAAEAARSCGKPDAARRLGNLVTALASGWD
ncbi:MAG: undecaprenyldiphospho-muramoylpentapeptide beta-N-acetylglucosaminyltransferase [Rhodospirillales bacterium]|nr:undecaprenyldiphospho-muramoylpentapeptide beta-N-acetylglucosaminyltransferase [Rhodospirillales bacterium]